MRLLPFVREAARAAEGGEITGRTGYPRKGTTRMAHSRDEVEATIQRYLAVRDGIDAGNGTWADLAQFFTDDAVFVDPAWGRVEGIEEMKATVFGDAMVGFEEWKFPVEFYAVDGDNVVVKWSQVIPG